MTAHRKAEVTGRFVQFYLRNPKAKIVRWVSCWKAWYRSHEDALKAKKHYEEKGRILWACDMKPEKKPEPKQSRPMRVRSEPFQQEMRV